MVEAQVLDREGILVIFDMGGLVVGLNAGLVGRDGGIRSAGHVGLGGPSIPEGTGVIELQVLDREGTLVIFNVGGLIVELIVGLVAGPHLALHVGL